MTRERRRVAGKVLLGALGALGLAAVAAVLALALVPVGGAGCGSGDADTDADSDTDTDVDCEVDDSQKGGTDPEWELVPGADGLMGFVCPPFDIDYYWFSVPQNGMIASVHLANNVGFSPVDYCYRISESDDSGVGSNCDHDGLDGVTDLRGTHYIRESGTYFLEVRDEASDDEDGKNPYLISLELTADPDGYEPNDTMAEAKADGAEQGYISYLGDRDWYAVPAQAGQIVEIDLTTDGPGQVDLRYTLYEPDGETPVNTGFQFDGTQGATALNDVLPLHQTGTYYLVVEDEDDDDSDLERGYSLALTTRSNPDGNEPNDGYDTATDLTSGAAAPAAYVATRGDEDWYRISEAGVTDSDPALMEIDLQFAGSSPVQPAIDLIVAHPYTACEPGDACDYINNTCGGCNDAETDIERKECLNAQCPSHECDQFQGKCRGAGICLPGGCALRHLTMQGSDWSESGSARHLHTVAPMYGDLYYLLVRDFGSSKTDPDNAYTLTVTVIDEPDAYESPPNGIYLPYATNEQDEATHRWNFDLAKSINCDTSGDPIVCDTITGYLSFRGDQDWYSLNIPAEAEDPAVDKSTKVDYDMQFDWSFNGNSAMRINYGVFDGKGRRPRMGWREGPGSGTFGDNECAYFCGEYHGGRPVYLKVQHDDRKQYDYSNPYSVTVRAIRRCPLSCEFCEPGRDDYACPNPDNTNPAGGG